LIRKIWSENMLFWHLRNTFDPLYYNFMSSLLTLEMHPSTQSSGGDLDLKSVQCGLRFALGTLVHAREKELVHDWCRRLAPVLTNNPRSATWFLSFIISEKIERNNDIVKLLLLDIDDRDTRSAACSVICASIYAYHQVARDPAQQHISVALEKGSCLSALVADVIMSNLREAQIQWRKINSFFKPLVCFCEIHAVTRKYALERGYLARLLSFILANETPYPELVGGNEPSDHKSRSMSDGLNFPDLFSLLDTIALLLRSSVIPNREERFLRSTEAELTVSAKEQAMLESPVFFYRYEHFPSLLLFYQLRDTDHVVFVLSLYFLSSF